MDCFFNELTGFGTVIGGDDTRGGLDGSVGDAVTSEGCSLDRQRGTVSKYMCVGLVFPVL